MKEKQQFLVPPRFNDKFLLGGFYSVLHVVAIVSTGFFGIILAMKGAILLLIVPGSLVVFCFRIKGEITVWQFLMTRFRYFNSDNSFSLEECKKLWK